MVRTVRVRLELDRNDFKQGLRDSAGDLRGFDAEVKTLGKDTDRTTTGLKSASTEAKKLGDDVKRSARDLDDAGAAMKRIGTETEKARGSIKLFGKELVSLGSGGKGQGLLGGALGQGLSSVSGMAPTGIVQWLVGAAVLAAPAMGAAISAGVLLGLGGATLAGGIIAAAKDPGVKAAFGSLGTEVAGDMAKASQVFVAPLAASAEVFRSAWKDVGPQIAADFEAVAPAIAHLSAGVADFAHNLMPGFNQAVVASVPLLNQLGDDTLPRMGSAIGQFFSAISQGGPGAQVFFRDLTTGADLSVKQLGAVTLALTKMYETMRTDSALGAVLGGTFNAWATGLEKLDGGAKTSKKSLEELNIEGNKAAQGLANVASAALNAGLGVQLSAADFQAFQSKISLARQDTDALAASMVDKLLGSMLSLDQANLGTAESLTRVSDAVRTNGHELDIHTAKGQANREAVLSAVQANVAQYDSLIRAGAGADEAAAAYNVNTGALERQMRQAGFTQGQIDGLVGKYRDVPKNVDTNIEMHGLAQAIGDLNTTLRLINGLHDKTVYVDVITSQVGGPVGVRGPVVSRANRYGGVYEHAAVGKLRDASISSAMSPARYAYAEPATGGEAFVPKYGNYDRSMSILGKAASWYGASVVPGRMAAGGTQTVVHEHHVTVAYPDGRKIGELLISDADHGGTAVTTFIRRVANR